MVVNVSLRFGCSLAGRGVNRRALRDYDSLDFPSIVFQVNL